METDYSSKLTSLTDSIQGVFVGPIETTRLAVTTLVARGHVLLEDSCGLGKTVLAAALAKSMDAAIKHIHLTEDVAPDDLLGASVFSEQSKSFEFRPGPIFTNIAVVDGIGRAAPKTLSALLETMEDPKVRGEGYTRTIPQPFMVIASHNPVEYDGAFGLPAQTLSPFLMRLRIDYPAREEERRLIRDKDHFASVESMKPVISTADMKGAQQLVDSVRMEDSLVDGVIEIAHRTRTDKRIVSGLSPNDSMLICRAAQSYALLMGRSHVTADDVKSIAVPAIAHRLVLKSAKGGWERVKESESLAAEITESADVRT